MVGCSYKKRQREELRAYKEQRASSGESERVERKHDENGTQMDIRKLARPINLKRFDATR